MLGLLLRDGVVLSHQSLDLLVQANLLVHRVGADALPHLVHHNAADQIRNRSKSGHDRSANRRNTAQGHGVSGDVEHTGPHFEPALHRIGLGHVAGLLEGAVHPLLVPGALGAVLLRIIHGLDPIIHLFLRSDGGTQLDAAADGLHPAAGDA